MYLIKNISVRIKKFVWVDYVLLFFISLITVLKTGITGVISPVDTMFSYYPLQDFIRYSYIWFGSQNGYVFIPTHMSQLPLLGGSSLLNAIGFPLWMINRVWFVIPIFLFGCSAYYFTSSIMDKDKNKRLISLFASLFFILNYYTVMTISIGGIREFISVAFSIFSLAFFIKGIRTKDTKYIALIAISSVFAVGVVAYAIIAIFLAALFAIVHLFIKREFKQDIKFTFFSLSMFLLSSLWWILPLSFTSTVQYYTANPSNSVQSIASVNSLLRTLILKNSIPALPVNEIQFSALANIAGILIVILAFTSLLFKEYRKIAIWASFAILVLIPFALGGAPPFGSIYIFAYNHIPMFYIFRNPTRFTAYIALFYALLTSITLVSIIQLVKQKLHKNLIKNTIMSIIVSSVLLLGFINSQPLLSGNMGGALKPAVLPQSYADLRNFLSAQNNDGNMLVLPMPAWFSDFTWHDDMNHIINPITYVSPIPLIYDEFNEANLNELQKDLAHQLYKQQDQSPYSENVLTNLFRSLNVRYILIQADQTRPITGMSSGTNPIIIEQIKNNLNHYPYVHMKESFGDLSLYEVDDAIFLPQIYASLDPVLIAGDVEGMLGIAASTDFISSRSVFFSLSQLNPSQVNLLESHNTTMLTEDAVNVTVRNAWNNPFNWASINPVEYVARFYSGWKNGVNTKGLEEENTLSFSSPNACPYVFPSYSPDGWNAFNSTFVYIKTGNNPLVIENIYRAGKPVNLTYINAWWETSWMGMDTMPKTSPIILPPNQKAIINIFDGNGLANLTFSTLSIGDIFTHDSPMPTLTFQKINPTKYSVQVNASTPFYLVFSGSYDENWIATIDGQQVPSEHHFTANGFANGWYINKTDPFTITLEFWPQNLFYVGSAISISTLILCTIYLSKDKIKIIYQKHIKKTKFQMPNTPQN